LRPFALHRDCCHNHLMKDVFRITNIDPTVIETERSRVLHLIGTAIPSEHIHEVGSTAVQGVVGKQDLDFLVLVPKQVFGETRAVLDRLFRRNPEQLSNDVYQGYTVSSDLDVAVQLTVAGGLNDTFLKFVDLLRGSEELRTRYNQLKADFNGRPMCAYRDAKREFIETALSGANDN
jgi:GrpB-like predicted nucleotidyltransferase (UPF0157 family)